MVFYMYERAREDVGAALAMAMAMEALDVGGQLIGQLIGTDAEAGARRAGIVEERLDLGVARVDAQAEAQAGMGASMARWWRAYWERELKETWDERRAISGASSSERAGVKVWTGAPKSS